MTGVRDLFRKREALRRACAVLKAQARLLSPADQRDAIAEAREFALLLESIESDLDNHDRDLKRAASVTGRGIHNFGE